MNPARMAHGMNGFNHGSTAPSSSNPFNDFSSVNSHMFSNITSSLPAHDQRHQHRQHPSQQQQSTYPLEHEQWSQPMRQNPMHHIPLQPTSHNQMYSQMAWPNANGIQNQRFTNGPLGFSGFNMPFFSPQMMQDTFVMGTPVESTDEKILLQALVDGRNRRLSYKDALNALHGKNGHSASQWKDYYLDHKDRLDETVSVYMNPPKVALQSIQPIKKPSPSTFKMESSPVRSLSKLQTLSEKSSHHPQHPATSGKRNTINSLTTPAPVFGDRLPAPNADIQIPDPPSRSPSPPTVVIPHRGRGNKYTPEDRVFFLKFIAWRLKGDPSLTRNDLCALLAEKAPHHTAQSWASYWSNRHDIPDKILAAAKGDEYESIDSESEEEKVAIRRRPKYKESSTEEEDEEEEEDTQAEAESDDDEPVRALPESEMGPKGGPFTKADLYVTAKYMASFSNFDEASGKDRWEPFSDLHPQRSAKSWAEYYRRNERALQKMANKIKQQSSESSIIKNQRGRPSWASTGGNSTHSKRKHCVDLDAEGDDDDECSPNRNKRERGAE